MFNKIVALIKNNRKPQVIVVPVNEEPTVMILDVDDDLMELVDAAQAIATADLMDWCIKADPRGYTPAERIQYGRQANMLRQWGETVLY